MSIPSGPVIGSSAASVYSSGAVTTAGYGSTAASTGFLSGATATGVAQVITVIGLIKLFIGMNRIAPDTTVDVGGKPAMAQISWTAALKNILKVTSSVATAVAAVAVVTSLLKKTIGLLNPPSDANQTSAGIASGNIARSNPYENVLTTAIGACVVYSTATSATIYLSGFTATTTAGLTWWNFQNNLASTATGSYQSVLYTAKYFTDALCGVTPPNNVITLDDILDASADGAAPVEGMITPSVETMAGTLADTNYITSATNAIFTIINSANTTTVTDLILTEDIALLETYMNSLMDRIDADVTNQATYMSQANHLTVLDNAARLLNNVRDNHSGDTFELYKATLNPELKKTILGLAALKDLDSSNTATVAAAVAAFEAGTYD